MRTVWPFRPTIPVTESYQWQTDVFQAKAGEQRIALRTVPARSLTYRYEVDRYTYQRMEWLVRAAASSDGLYVPDWTQVDKVSGLLPDSTYDTGESIDARIYGENGIIWSSQDDWEQVDVALTSSGYEIDRIAQAYDGARIMPLWESDLLGDLSITPRGKSRVAVEAEFLLNAHEDLSFSSKEQYREHDVLEDCPILGGGLSGSLEWETSVAGARLGNASNLRARDYPRLQFALAWQTYTATQYRDLLRWISSRYGRQVGFWVSTFQKDLELAADISGTTMSFFVGEAVRPVPFDIEVVSFSGQIERRQVTALASGSPVNGRSVLEATLDSSLSIAAANVKRVSLLVFARFAADRVEFSHAPRVVSFSMPCVEVPVP